MMTVSCLKVKKKFAETARKILLKNDLLDNGFSVVQHDDHVLLPLSGTKLPEDLRDEIGPFSVVEEEMERRKERPRTYKDLTGLPSNLQEMLPSSFDIIGDVAILKLDEILSDHYERIGSALLEFNRNIKKAAVDRGVKGELRVRDLKVIAGGGDLETTHIENNLRFVLDPSRVYFSPRLATERMRVASLVSGERVLDMFSGIGPFALNIARHGDPDHVVGIDLNPDCINYFQRNIRLNSLEDTVEAQLGDSREISSIFGPYDRVVMNLPHSSREHLPTALEIMEEGTIHLYRIMEQDMCMREAADIVGLGTAMGRKITVQGLREVHNYSPTQSLFVLDLSIG
ncbi:MAG: class I SAM-dependent methyltransferase [Thermoplasmatota archaeon]